MAKRSTIWQNNGMCDGARGIHPFQVCILFVLAAASSVLTGCGSIAWQYDLGRGIQDAALRRRRAVVVFSAASSPDSREMDWTVWSDPKVQELMREFVAVRQDFFMKRAEAERLGVKDVPAIVVVRPDGSIAGSQTGKLDAEGLRVFLIRNRFN